MKAMHQDRVAHLDLDLLVAAVSCGTNFSDLKNGRGRYDKVHDGIDDGIDEEI